MKIDNTELREYLAKIVEETIKDETDNKEKTGFVSAVTKVLEFMNLKLDEANNEI